LDKIINIGLNGPKLISCANCLKSTPNKSNNVKAIADSGANIHLGDAQTPCTNLNQTNPGLPAQLPDGSLIRSSHSGILPLTSKLSTQAKTMHIFPQLQSGPLLSLGVFADDGCRIILTKTAIVIEKSYQPIVTNPIITGDRNVTTGMWEIDLGRTSSPKQSNNQALPVINNVLAEATKPQLIQYYHAACFSPVQSTWIKAIQRGAFKSWPGLTVDAVRKHFTKAVSTTLGHMHQTRQGIRSTKPRSDDTQSPTIQEDRTNMVYLAIIDPKDPSGNIYTDLCGRFPILSSQGNQYIFILYDYDSNAILARAMKNRADKEMTRVFSELADTLKDRGFKPQYHVLNNECSAA
jgi:hypothetical protein